MGRDLRIGETRTGFINQIYDVLRHVRDDAIRGNKRFQPSADVLYFTSSYERVFWCVFLYFFVPLGNSGRFSPGKPAETESCYPTVINY